MYYIGTPDGYLGKTNKAKGLKYLPKEIETAEKPSQGETLQIICGNAMYHSKKEVSDTFGEIAKSIFKMIPHERNVIFSTDMYLSWSIKSKERNRHGDILSKYLM